MFKSFIRYFVQGVLIIVPLAITVVIIVKIIEFIGSLFSSIGLIISPVVDPFIILGVVIVLIFLAGLLASSLFFSSIFNWFERTIEKAPLIKIIYSSVKDFLSAFVGKKKRFNKPVMITVNKEADIRQLGFITQSDLNELGIGNEMVAVYVPFSYGFSGRLIIAHRDSVTLLDASPTEVMKFIISGGVTELD